MPCIGYISQQQISGTSVGLCDYVVEWHHSRLILNTHCDAHTTMMLSNSALLSVYPPH